MKALKDSFIGSSRNKMEGEDAAMLDLPASWNAHPVSHGTSLLPPEEEPPHLRSTTFHDPLAETEYATAAVLDHGKPTVKNDMGWNLMLCGCRGLLLGHPKRK